jgi:peptide/nickel transport system permease protein
VIKYVARRALHAVPVLFGISLVAFFLVRLVPGDPVEIMLGLRPPPEAAAQLRAYYGLDQPLPVQYVTFMLSAIRLDFGQSIQAHTAVTSLIASRIGPTILLVVYATAISLVLAVPMGAYSAVKANGLPDESIRLLMTIAFAMPAFWLGLILILVFSLTLHLFPTAGLRDGALPLIWSLTLPALTIGLATAPILIRSLRASMIESLRADHVVAARARGLPESLILRRHVLRTSLISTVTIVGLNTGFLLSGAVIVENVFALPGLGSLMVHAVGARDFPVVVAVALLFGVGVVLVSLVTDLANALLDPRIRL